MCEHVAGDPRREDLVWTYLRPSEIARELEKMGTPVCANTVRDLMDRHGLRRRQPAKTTAMGDDPDRDAQFQNIARLKELYLDSPNPIISMDTKKKELLGDFYRDGRCYGNAADRVFDHDFPGFATGVVIPHGLYDLKRNAGHLTLGLSHDTSQFACDSLALWWRRHGRQQYPDATSLLLLCDGGGSNNCRHHIFKEDLTRLATRLDLPIRVAHYPPYCSKYNPIEHRLFPHVARAWSGVVFRGLEIVTECLRRVWTKTGLRLTYAVLDKCYALKRQASDRFLLDYPIAFDDHLPAWNYTALPAAP